MLWRTMYRVLAGAAEVRERRAQRRHPVYTKPELLATAPNRVWSWDITKLLGAQKWTYYYLYVILDIFSRYVVGWMVAERESATLAEQSIDWPVVERLRLDRHDVVCVAELAPSVLDEEVLQRANVGDAVLVTGDKDLGDRAPSSPAAASASVTSTGAPASGTAPVSTSPPRP